MPYSVLAFTSGNSTVITIPRSICIDQDIEPGTPLTISPRRDGSFTVEVSDDIGRKPKPGFTKL